MARAKRSIAVSGSPNQIFKRSVGIWPVLPHRRGVVDDEIARAAGQSGLDRIDARTLAAAVRAEKDGVAGKLDVFPFDQVEVDQGQLLKAGFRRVRGWSPDCGR